MKKINQIGDNYRLYSFFNTLSIGIITVSFLVMILRFVAKQFIKNQNELIRTQQEILQARKFYLTVKSSQSDKERILALKTFLTSEFNIKPEEQSGIDDSNANILIKEILNVVSKKL